MPQRRLASSGYYHSLDRYRFPEGLFEAFRQVVLSGVRRETAVADPRAKQVVEAWAGGDLPERSRC